MSECSLVELAREAIARAEREMARDNLDYAAGVVAGYEAGVASVHHDGVRDYSGALKVANERIAELESLLAAAQTSAAPVAGVVVTKEMVNVALNEWLTGDHREMNGTPDVIRAMLTAALTNATTVPLSSAEQVRWIDEERDNVFRTRAGAALNNSTTVTPLYAGLAEPAQRGEG